jgi:hypothetical protein
MATAILEELKTKTNAELIEYCNNNNIEVKHKNAKPNKTELLTAIEAWMNQEATNIKAEPVEDQLDDVEINKEEELDDFDNFDPQVPSAKSTEPSKTSSKLLSNKDKLKIIKEAKALKRVIVNLNQAYGENVKEGQVMRVSIGNAVLNPEDEIFPIGKPWHLTNAAVKQLDSIVKQVPIIDQSSGLISGYKTVKKFFITELPPLTEQELKALAKKQLIRNAGSRM